MKRSPLSLILTFSSLALVVCAVAVSQERKSDASEDATSTAASETASNDSAGKRSTATEATSNEKRDAKDSDSAEPPYVPKSERELRRTLSKLQFEVTQNEATEPAFRNRYWNNKQKGVYKCIVCGRDLFSSDTKYKSGTGWPSFFAPIDPKNVGYRVDYRLFYARTEVHCSRCNAHLGHVFDDGPRPTGKRFCMNSAALKFVPSEKSGKKSDKKATDTSSTKGQADSTSAEK